MCTVYANSNCVFKSKLPLTQTAPQRARASAACVNSSSRGAVLDKSDISQRLKAPTGVVVPFLVPKNLSSQAECECSSVRSAPHRADSSSAAPPRACRCTLARRGRRQQQPGRGEARANQRRRNGRGCEPIRGERRLRMLWIDNEAEGTFKAPVGEF